MSFALYIDVIPEGGGRVSVTHIFWGETEEECRENFAAHAKGCNFLTPAIAEDRIGEELERVKPDEWPDYPDPDEDEDDDDAEPGEGDEEDDEDEEEEEVTR